MKHINISGRMADGNNVPPPTSGKKTGSGENDPRKNFLVPAVPHPFEKKEGSKTLTATTSTLPPVVEGPPGIDAGSQGIGPPSSAVLVNSKGSPVVMKAKAIQAINPTGPFLSVSGNLTGTVQWSWWLLPSLALTGIFHFLFNDKKK